MALASPGARPILPARGKGIIVKTGKDMQPVSADPARNALSAFPVAIGGSETPVGRVVRGQGPAPPMAKTVAEPPPGGRRK